MKNKKNILICLMAGLMMFACLTGCAGKEENEKEAAGWRKQAEKLAVSHVEKKYGFTPNVIESESNRSDSVTGYRMGVAYLDTTYDKNYYEWHEGTEIEGYIVYRLSMKNKDRVSLRLLFETDENTY